MTSIQRMDCRVKPGNDDLAALRQMENALAAKLAALTQH
jgi:hypothetical protein